MRTFCVDEFAEHGLDIGVAQCSLSYNRLAGTLRGIHFQKAPLEEAKLVRVQRGAIWDVIVDLRKGSPTFRSWYGVTLTAENACAVHAPKGFGHGFVTLVDDTDVFYQMSVSHVPHMAWGICWDDPDIAIAWPTQPTVISDKDRALPLLAEAMLALPE
jgi:dTDP-4-dehydrorhamnose 3,5-epimerase